MPLLSPTEQAYLNGTQEFTKAQQRYIRCRPKKKLRLLDEEGRNAAAALQRGCNGLQALGGTWTHDLRETKGLHETSENRKERPSSSAW